MTADAKLLADLIDNAVGDATILTLFRQHRADIVGALRGASSYVNDDARRYREALERIVSGVPAHSNEHGLFVAHFDGNGNEIGIEQVDPMAVIGCILGTAHAALNSPAPTCEVDIPK